VGAWIRRRNGKSSQPRKMPENAARTPSRLHALLGNFTERKTRLLQKDTTANLRRFYA